MRLPKIVVSEVLSGASEAVCLQPDVGNRGSIEEKLVSIICVSPSSDLSGI